MGVKEFVERERAVEGGLVVGNVVGGNPKS
jgi:hypothetical protein